MADDLLSMSLDDIIAKSKKTSNRGGSSRGGSSRGGSSRGGSSRGRGSGSRGRNDSSPRRRRDEEYTEERDSRRDSGRASAAPYKVPARPRGDVNEAWVHDMFPGGRGSGRQTASRGGASGSSVMASTRIRVENLHWEVSKDDLEDLFGQFGTVKNVRLFYDESGRSDGNATIDFEEPQAASSAEATYNGVELDNHVMRINLVEVKQRPTQDPKFTVKLGGGMSAMRSDGKMAVGINSRIGGKKQQQQATIQDRLGKRVPEGKGKRKNSSSGGGAMRTSRGGSGGRGGRGRGDRERGRGSGRGRERKGPLTQADLDMDLDSYMTGDQEVAVAATATAGVKFDKRQVLQYEELEVPAGEAQGEPAGFQEDAGME